MKKDFYTYEEALVLIKEKISSTNTKQKAKLKASPKTKPRTKGKALVHGDIADFCKSNNLDYHLVINCLNRKTESYPILVKELLEILLDPKNIKRQKRNIYFIE